MTIRLAGLLAAACLFGLSGGVAAQEVTLSWGAAVTSNYLDDGVTQSDDRPALQGYVEAERAGLYAGVWASTVAFDGDDPDDKLEIDLYLGFRNETMGGVGYDISYEQQFYDASGNCCGYLTGEVTVPVGGIARAGGAVQADLEDQEFTWTGLAGIEVAPALDLSARYGYSGEYGETFGDIGATYAMSERSSIDLRYHDTTEAGTDGKLVLTLGFANGFRNP